WTPRRPSHSPSPDPRRPSWALHRPRLRATVDAQPGGAMDRSIHETTSLCPTCREAVPALVVERSGRAMMTKRCPAHGAFEVELSDDASWYERTRAIAPRFAPPRPRTVVDKGCPFDCG